MEGMAVPCLFALFGAFFPRRMGVFIWIARPGIFEGAIRSARVAILGRAAGRHLHALALDEVDDDQVLRRWTVRQRDGRLAAGLTGDGDTGRLVLGGT